MSLADVVRHDLLDVRRSRLGAGLLAGHFVLVVLAFSIAAYNAPAEKTFAGLGSVTFLVWLVVPATGLLAGALAIASEHESGTLKFLLGFPNDRRDVLLGKFVSRAAVVDGGLLAGFAVVELVAVVLADDPRPLTILGFAILTVLFATSYVGLGIGISAAVTTQARAVAGSVGSYAVWTILWLPGFPSSIPTWLGARLGSAGFDTQRTTAVLEVVNPPTAYSVAGQVLGPSFESVARSVSTTPVLVSPVVAVSALVAWVVLPLGLGYWRFRRAEVN